MNETFVIWDIEEALKKVRSLLGWGWTVAITMTSKGYVITATKEEPKL